MYHHTQPLGLSVTERGKNIFHSLTYVSAVTQCYTDNCNVSSEHVTVLCLSLAPEVVVV